MTYEMRTLEEFREEQKNVKEEGDFELDFKPDYFYSDNASVIAELQAGKKTFGSPAASLTWGIDGNRMKASLRPGIDGEKQVASILDSWVKETPGAFVFHSLSWPDSNGDTDHIVVYKDIVIVVDAKRWKSQRKYSVTDKGNVKRGTVAFKSGQVKIRWALNAWRRKIPNDVKVFGIVCIAQEKVFVSRDKNWYKSSYRLVEAEKLKEQLNYIVQNNESKTGKVSGQLLLYFARLLVKPRNVLDEILNKEAFE